MMASMMPTLLLLPLLSAMLLLRSEPASARPTQYEVSSLPGWDGPLVSRTYCGFGSAGTPPSGVGESTRTDCTAYAASSSSPHSQCSATPYDLSSLATTRLSCLPRCCAPAAFPAWLTECAAAAVFFNYIFLESERDPENDPVVVWYNGGPGAASMFGLFVEIGPYLLNKDSVDPLDPEGMETVLANPYSWTKVANVVAVNNPPPIGFSYCTGGDPANTGPSGDGYSCGAWNDGLTAAANRAFLASLFLNDFPEVSPQLTAAHIDMNVMPSHESHLLFSTKISKICI